MTPSEENVAKFLAIAPRAGDGKAFAFLEGAATFEDAVAQYYDNPEKYSKGLAAGQVASHANASTSDNTAAADIHAHHTNVVIQAGIIRSQDEQEMQNQLQTVQLKYKIYNADIEPEHEVDYYCTCPIHQYKLMKWKRLDVQNMWSNAVMYPGERAYDNCYRTSIGLFSGNPYRYAVISPYALYSSSWWGSPNIVPHRYTRSVQQTIALNASLNAEAQASIDAQEPSFNIWHDEVSAEPSSKTPISKDVENKGGLDKETPAPAATSPAQGSKGPWYKGLKKALSVKSPEEKTSSKERKRRARGAELRESILHEENCRWPTVEWRELVFNYQEKVGMRQKIAFLREHAPIQYSHLLRAGYFEPIPVAWANQVSNPLKFSIEAASGWRGITPAWRGYEDTAEERLYWVLNHREGSAGPRLKPDQISALNMALARMASAVEPPPQYFSANDVCHIQHTSDGYSKQVLAPPFVPYDGPETANDDTMILLDVSGSMDFNPVRPIYDEYFITGYTASQQPKNKDLAKAIVRRFVDAMINHSHNGHGYDLTTFADYAKYIGVINHRNFDHVWDNVRLGGGTRVMSGWQMVKQLHFEKHQESAFHHPVYGWQAGPETPILRLLLLLDGEATDMDEFELDLLGCSWAHVTVFLIGVDGCPHHHRHANELQRISEVNHHVSFVDAQGNTPERFVTHELLKRHLGYDVTMREFEELEQPPPYSAT